MGAAGPGIYPVRIEHATPHMLYGKIVDAAGRPLEELPQSAPEAAALSAPLQMA